jgi:hypothetical protein
MVLISCVPVVVFLLEHQPCSSERDILDMLPFIEFCCGADYLFPPCSEGAGVPAL